MSQDTFALANKVINAVDVVMGYWDSDLRCQFANAAHKTWFGRSPSEMLAIPIGEFLGPHFEIDLPHIIAALKGERAEVVAPVYAASES